MGIGFRIKEARESLGLTQTELGKIVGVTGSAITNYENETSHPKEPVMYKLIEALKVDANYLFQDCVNLPKEINDVTLGEYNMVKKYRSLDEIGKSHIDYELNREIQRIKTIEDLKKNITNMENSKEFIPTRIFAYYGKIAAAGKNYGFGDIIAGTKEYPVTDINVNADYTIGISGDSMEPTYFDGDIVYVQRNVDLNIGDIGIFQKDNGIYIKEAGENGLISHNGKYKPMVNGGDVICLGKVIGKAENG